MANSDKKGLPRFLIAVVIGGMLGAVVGVVVKFTILPRAGSSGSISDSATEGVVAQVVQDSVSWKYARAYQEGQWTFVIDSTLWMKERLEFVARSGDPESVDEERNLLIVQVSTRRISDNHLAQVGVDDQYVFTPGATLNFVVDDEGRDDLAAPVARRTWLNVNYPVREKALLDHEGFPIRSVNVGVNISEQGDVLKAGVVGNLDIDWDSIKYDWPSK